MAVGSKGRKGEQTHLASGRSLRATQGGRPRLAYFHYYSHEENAVSVMRTPLSVPTEANLVFENPMKTAPELIRTCGPSAPQNWASQSGICLIS